MSNEKMSAKSNMMQLGILEFDILKFVSERSKELFV